MKRAALERPRAFRNWRRHAAMDALIGRYDSKLQPGHFRKGRRVGGCGSVACWLCHPSKLGGYPTLQEMRHNFVYREQLAEAVV